MPDKNTKWQKPTPEMIELFDQLLPPNPLIERRKMFGFPAAFVNGNMFAWIHQNNIALRLPEAARKQLMADAQAAPIDPTGRRMREYVALADPTTSEMLVNQSFEYVAALPPKVKK